MLSILQAPTCFYEKVDNRSGDSSRKTEGLDEEGLQDEDDEGKCLLSFKSPFPDQYSIT